MNVQGTLINKALPSPASQQRRACRGLWVGGAWVLLVPVTLRVAKATRYSCIKASPQMSGIGSCRPGMPNFCFLRNVDVCGAQGAPLSSVGCVNETRSCIL